MEWLIALAIVAGNTITVLIVQLFGNRRQKAETEFSIVQAQHVVLRDLRPYHITMWNGTFVLSN